MGWVLPGERDWSRVTREEVSRTMYLVSCVLEFLAPGASFEDVKLKGGWDVCRLASLEVPAESVTLQARTHR